MFIEGNSGILLRIPMTTITTLNIPPFGDLHFENGHAELFVPVAGHEVELEIDFEEAEPNAQALSPWAQPLAHLDILEQHARTALRDNLKEAGPEAALQRYRTELDEASLQRVFGVTEVQALSDEAYLAAFKLVRVGVYPEHAEGALHLSFRVDPEEQKHFLISVAFDADGHVEDVAFES